MEPAMSASTTLTRIVRVRVKEGNTGLFYAESSDLRGLLVAAEDMNTLWERVPGAIKDLYKATGTSVVVTRAQDEDPHTYPFAAIPTEILAQLTELAQREALHH
jgi:hypothetical protein